MYVCTYNTYAYIHSIYNCTYICMYIFACLRTYIHAYTYVHFILIIDYFQFLFITKVELFIFYFSNFTPLFNTYIHTYLYRIDLLNKSFVPITQSKNFILSATLNTHICTYFCLDFSYIHTCVRMYVSIMSMLY